MTGLHAFTSIWLQALPRLSKLPYARLASMIKPCMVGVSQCEVRTVSPSSDIGAYDHCFITSPCTCTLTSGRIRHCFVAFERRPGMSLVPSNYLHKNSHMYGKFDGLKPDENLMTCRVIAMSLMSPHPPPYTHIHTHWTTFDHILLLHNTASHSISISS